MNLIHIGLVSSSRENADRFFSDLLGLPMTRESRLPPELAAGLFGVEDGCDIVYYGERGLVFEVFLTGWQEPVERKISHTCIEVADRADLLARCRRDGFGVREVARGDSTLVFIEDTDGNLFEVKEIPAP